jgi:L-threonylcarbamoyladenylate synthase
VYALACDACNAKAIQTIRSLKGRQENKPLSILVHSLSIIEKKASVSEQARHIMREFMPGPLTCILKLKDPSLKSASAGGDTIGFRMPDHHFAMAVLKAHKLPLVATSVNISGSEAAVSADEVIDFCRDKIAYYLQKEATAGKASTVVDLTGSKPVILREGAISLRQIEASLKEAYSAQHILKE